MCSLWEVNPFITGEILESWDIKNTACFINLLRSHGWWKGQNLNQNSTLQNASQWCVRQGLISSPSYYIYWKGFQTTLLFCAFLYCTSKGHVYLQIESAWQPAWSKSINTIFSPQHLLVSMSHLVILPIFHFYIVLYFLWGSVINDLWCYYYNYFGLLPTTLIQDDKTLSVNALITAFWLLHLQADSPSLSLSFSLPIL